MGWQSIQIVGASACVIFILPQKIQKMAKRTFWYQLTRVVLDKVQRAVKWLCVVCVHGPFDNPHVTCAVSIIIFFICCQCSFTPRYFYSASATSSMHRTACPLLTIYALVQILHLEWPWHYKPLLCPSVAQQYNQPNNLTVNRTSCICHQLGFLLHEQSVAND